MHIIQSNDAIQNTIFSFSVGQGMDTYLVWTVLPNILLLPGKFKGKKTNKQSLLSKRSDFREGGLNSCKAGWQVQ